MTLPTISALPTPPSRSDSPATFNMNADAFLGAFPTLQSEINAWAAALPATVSGADYSGTSTTSLLIGTGTKNLTTQTGKNFTIGQSVRIAYTTTPSDYMDGQVTAYTSGSGAMTVEVSAVGGAGTQSLWTISLSAGGGSTATLAGTETLTNKTLTTPVLSGTSSGTTAGRLGYSGGAVTFGNGSAELTFASTTGTQTLTGKTISLTSNTLDGTTAEFNAALSDGDFATLAGSETLTNKTLTAPALNTAALNAASTVSDSGTIATTSVGFRGVPQSSNATATLALTDNGKHLYVAANQTIPANASVAFPVGATITIVNSGGSTINISITSDTLRQAGTANTGTRTLSAYGMATIIKVASTVWMISGNVS